MGLDLRKYKSKILADEDRLLFEETQKCAKAGAFRAAYTFIWIAAAESLKRRFQEAYKWDNQAGKVVGKIKDLESQERSIDKTLLDEAKEYGFISLTVHSKLAHIYVSRSIYAHPYEEAPKEEELLNAISVVVDYVLSQPIKLKEGFINNQLREILENPQFLDDTRERVEEYAKIILQKIATASYPYMLEKLSQRLEGVIKDPSLKVISRRGIWIGTALAEASLELKNKQEWHDFVNRFPRVSSILLANDRCFPKIGVHAQDTVVGNLLDNSSKTRMSLLRLEELSEAGLLSKRQSDRFEILIDKFGFEIYGEPSAKALLNSGLKTKTCFSPVIAHLKTHNWYSQNPAILFVLNNGAIQVESLDQDSQITLGRNILQSADGGAAEAGKMLSLIEEGEDLWPIDFVYGLLLECFVNEDHLFRLKIWKLEVVLEILEKFPEATRKSLITELIEGIEKSKIKHKNQFRRMKEDLEELSKICDQYPWAKKIGNKVGKFMKLKKKEWESEE